MSIWINGRLSVQTINGINGEFSVAKLDSEIGVLNIKDSFLDQFESGVYEGRFAVSRVFSNGYSARTGCYIVETRAVIEDYQIFSDEAEGLASDIALSETDPLDEERQQTHEPEPETPVEKEPHTPRSTRPGKQPSPTAVDPDAAPASPAKPDDEDSLEALFGELWPLGDSVKLDPTSIRTDREGHRKRCNYLKTCGYQFSASTQSWNLTSR